MSDDYAQSCPSYDEGQPEVDYLGGSGINTPPKGGRGPCSRAANTAKCRRWRQSHRSHRREYMRHYMAAWRARR